MSFTGNVSVTQVGDTRWRLDQALSYGEHTVPVGTETDFASVPRIFVWLVPTYGSYTKAAILHDYLCEKPRFPRAIADWIFRNCLYELKVPFVRRWLMWAAVRVGARFAGTKPIELLRWLLIALPSVALLLLPAVTVGLALVAFWLLELAVFVVLLLLGREPVRPKLWPPKRQPANGRRAVELVG
jgi:hypothetical protein